MQEIYDLIEAYDNIVITRHKMPDLDAYGSSFGLYYALKEKHPNKNIVIYAKDTVKKFDLMGTYSNTLEGNNYLLITCDTPTLAMLDFDLFDQVDKIVKIDHHLAREDFGDVNYVDPTMESCASIIYDFIKKYYVVNYDAAFSIMCGIVGDSGRFLYDQVNSETFRRASELMTYGIKLSDIYNNIYKRTRDDLVLDAYVLAHIKYEDNIAYIKYPLGTAEKFNVNVPILKSGTINKMRDIEGIDAWATFTEIEDGKTIVELRSYYDVLDVCKNNGGGGHKQACGCTINTSDVDKVIKEIKEAVKSYGNN